MMISKKMLFSAFVFLLTTFLTANRLLEIKWIDEVKEGEHILCSNHPNIVSWIEKGEIKSYWAYVYPYKKTNSAQANLRVSLTGDLGNAKLIGEDLAEGNRFNFNGKKWEIVSLGFSGIRTKKINGDHYLLGYEYCSRGFMYLRSIGENTEMHDDFQKDVFLPKSVSPIADFKKMIDKFFK